MPVWPDTERHRRQSSWVPHRELQRQRSITGDERGVGRLLKLPRRRTQLHEPRWPHSDANARPRFFIWSFIRLGDRDDRRRDSAADSEQYGDFGNRQRNW
jgi:hypothetical protein